MKKLPSMQRIKAQIMTAADDNFVNSFLDFRTQELDISCELSAGLLDDSLEISSLIHLLKQ